MLRIDGCLKGNGRHGNMNKGLKSWELWDDQTTVSEVCYKSAETQHTGPGYVEHYLFGREYICAVIYMLASVLVKSKVYTVGTFHDVLTVYTLPCLKLKHRNIVDTHCGQMLFN